MKTNNEYPRLLELIGGAAAVLEAVDLLAHTPPENLALAAIVWLLMRDQ